MSGSLYLCPVDCQEPPPQAARILQTLDELELTGEPLADTEYSVGPNFNRHVVFAGCSPHLSYVATAPGDFDFCHIALLGPYTKIRLITGPHTRRPRCPICGKRALSWQGLQADWLANGQSAKYTCIHCDNNSPILAWRWQRQAVFGRVFLAIRGVFPSEAVPSEALLDALNRTTGCQWDYGWAATVKR